jgi:hypothetical protein
MNDAEPTKHSRAWRHSAISITRLVAIVDRANEHPRAVKLR